MRFITLAAAAAIALVAGLASASAAEKYTTLDGISAFDSLAGIQAIPLDTDELSAIAGAHFFKFDKKTGTWVVIETGHWSHYTHMDDHGVKGADGGGRMVESTDAGWGDAEIDIHGAIP